MDWYFLLDPSSTLRLRLQANIRPQTLILQTPCPWSHYYFLDTCHHSWPWDYPKLLQCRFSRISWIHVHPWFVLTSCQGRSTGFSTPLRRKVEATSRHWWHFLTCCKVNVWPGSPFCWQPQLLQAHYLPQVEVNFPVSNRKLMIFLAWKQ